MLKQIFKEEEYLKLKRYCKPYAYTMLYGEANRVVYFTQLIGMVNALNVANRFL